ncbi:MAG TPA: TolC family protein [Candidatus Binatia bacterium]|jgi:NodT family efflux transporter outer membrane factor (OMF) lipoprotein
MVRCSILAESPPRTLVAARWQTGTLATRLRILHPSGARLVILCAISLASCTVGPDYHPLPLKLGGFHNAAAIHARNAAAPAPPLDRWWTGFGDPELTSLIERALEQNLDLAAALARVDQARAAARGAGAALFPTADAAAQVSPIRQSLESPIGAIGGQSPGFDRNVTLYDIGVGASWEVDLFGGLRRGAQAAGAEAEAAQAAGVATRITVAAEAADAYFLVRGFQARLAFAREQIATDERLLGLIRLRFAHGDASELEVAQADALLAHARGTVPLLVSGLEAQCNRLDVLMAEQPGTFAGTFAAELASEAQIPAIPNIPSGDEPVDVLRRRPDVIAAERRVAASSARIGAALAEYYPKLSIAGLLGFESVDVDHLFRSATFQPQGIAGLRWRLFDFGKIHSEVAEARGAEAEALARFRSSILRAAEDVENAFMLLAESEARSNELASEVAALQKSRDLAETAYRGGAIGLTDVLDADRLLLVADDELAKTRADSARAAVASFRALGGGWSGPSNVATGTARTAHPTSAHDTSPRSPTDGDLHASAR